MRVDLSSLSDEPNTSGARRITSLLAVLVTATCACFVMLALVASGALAAPSAPPLLEEIAESEVPLNFKTANDIAVERANGDTYLVVANEVEKLSPYGAFILVFGREVDETKVALRKEEEAKSETVTVTAEQENVCTAVSGDTCSREGSSGSAAGQISNAVGVAVEQGSGAVFVVDTFNRRIDKFNSNGKFLLTFGLDVNKAKTATLASPPSPAEQAAANICAAGEECQAGQGGSAKGAFESPGIRPGVAQTAKTIAIGGAPGDEEVYVGDQARVEVFSANGGFVEQLSLSSISATAKVIAIAANAAGDVFFADAGVAGVHEAVTNAGGTLELSANVFDSSSAGVEALAATGSNLYVADSSPSTRMLDYEIPAPGGTPAEFAGNELEFPLGMSPTTIQSEENHGVNGLATNGAGALVSVFRAPLKFETSGNTFLFYPTIYQSSVNLYGSQSAMESSYGAPPALKPAIASAKVSASVEASSANLEAVVNPELRATTYQFEYGAHACGAGSCTKLPATPASLNATAKTGRLVVATASGLEVGRPYHYRVIAQNPVGAVETEHVFQIGSSQAAGPAVGLPDGRVYEQVSQPNKYGSSVEPLARPAFVSPSGDAVLYSGTGATAEASSNGMVGALAVSERTSRGWVSRSAMPLIAPGSKEAEENVGYQEVPHWVVPSDDLSHLLFNTHGNGPYVGAPDTKNLANNLFLTGSNSLVEPEWVGRSQIEGQPAGVGGAVGTAMQVAGASPDLKTIYFAYSAELLPGASDLYEYREGVLYDAGGLPEGETPSGAAVAAAQAGVNSSNQLAVSVTSVAGFSNQVSLDGSRIFFVRDDQAGRPELYVHITETDGSQRSELVSRSELSGQEGKPAAHGPHPMPSTAPEGFSSEDQEHPDTPSAPSYVFSSPDGSHAFFQSVDRLTEGAPASAAPKTYVFDLESGSLEYLPAITGSIVTVSQDGSSLVFENTSTEPFTLERWVAGANGGSVTDIAELPAPKLNECGEVVCVGPAYMSSDESVIAFNTEALIPGFSDGGTHSEIQKTSQGGYKPPREPKAGELPNDEVFRYDASSNRLDCVSCPGRGVVPTGNALLSKIADDGNAKTNDAEFHMDAQSNAMSPDGSEVFFETPDALVSQDTNGTDDVYEWEGGKDYLISSGHSSSPSRLLGVSESGGDVFFATAEGIASGDTGGEYDVYDARVPRLGDKPVEALPCEGAVCQGPPSVPNLLGQPASETFTGPGNLLPVPKLGGSEEQAGKGKVKAKKGGKAKTGKPKKCKGKAKSKKTCESKGKKGSAAKGKRHKGKASGKTGGRAASRSSHHNGRGK